MILQDYRRYYDHLNTRVAERMSDLAQQLLGQPTIKTETVWRYGSKGSLMIHVAGDKKGRFADFEAGVSGSALDFVSHQTSLTGKSLCQWARRWLGEEKTIWTPLMPIPSSLFFPSLSAFPLSYMMTNRTETARYAYCDERGHLIGYVIRLEDSNGGKVTPMLTYCQDQWGRFSWRWQGFGDNRPLYNLDKLTANPNKPILIVEGEKTADAAQTLFPEFVVVTWSGGVGSLRKSNWSVLKDRHVCNDN